MELHPMAAELLHAAGQTDRQTDRHDAGGTRVSLRCEHA
jgi:hypothetical protein